MLNVGGFWRSKPHTLVVNNAIKDTRPVSHPSSRGDIQVFSSATGFTSTPFRAILCNAIQ